MDTQPFIEYDVGGSAMVFRLTAVPKADAFQQLVDADTRVFPDVLALRLALIRQFATWNGMHLAWRHVFANGKNSTYLLVKSRKRMTPKTAEVILAALQPLVMLTPISDEREFRGVRKPYDRLYIAEIRQGSAQVVFRAGEVVGRELVAVVPYLYQPAAVDWDDLGGALARIGAPFTISNLLIPTELAPDEVAELKRIAKSAGELIQFSSHEGSFYDEGAEHASRVFAAFPQQLSQAFLSVIQIAAPSQETAQQVSKRLATATIQRTQAGDIPSDYTLHFPGSQDDLKAAKTVFHDLEHTPWGVMLVSPKLPRLPYLTGIDGASALLHVARNTIVAQIGEKRVEIKGDFIMTDNSKNINFSGAHISNSNINANIDSTLTNVSQTISTLPSADADSKQQLESLVKQLGELLKQAPPEHAQDAEVVAELTEEVITAANKPQPNPKMLEIKGEALKQAAENLKVVVPAVLMIATQIVGHILKLGM